MLGAPKFILMYYLILKKETWGERGRSNCAWCPPTAPPLDIGFPEETVHCCSWTTIPHRLCPKGLSFTLCSPPLITSVAKHHPAPLALSLLLPLVFMAGRAFLTAACLTKTPPLTKALPLSTHQVHKEPRSLLSVFWLSAPLLDPSAQRPHCSCPVHTPAHHIPLQRDLALSHVPPTTISSCYSISTPLQPFLYPVCFSFPLLIYPPGPTNGSFEPLSPSFKKQKG